MQRRNPTRSPRTNFFTMWRGSSSRRNMVIDEAREPLADVARFVEVLGHALRAPANGKGKAAKIRHDREYALVGDIVTDKDWTAALERFVCHQFEHTGCLAKAGVFDLAD